MLHLCISRVDNLVMCFIFAGAGIDPASLLIKEGKVCWDLYVDCLVISSDGNLLDALGAAIKVHSNNVPSSCISKKKKEGETCFDCFRDALILETATRKHYSPSFD